MSEKPTTVRLGRDAKAAVQAFADANGITFNAALKVLLTEALAARGNRPGPAA